MANGTWGHFFPLIVFLVSAGLVIFARIRGWQSYEHQEPADESSDASEGGNGSFLYQHRWGILLLVAVVAILLFAIVFAPPRLTGEIPPTPNQPGRPFYSLHWIRDFIQGKATSKLRVGAIFSPAFYVLSQ